MGGGRLQSHATSVCVCGQQERRSPWRQNVSHWGGFWPCAFCWIVVLTLYMFGLYCTHLPAAVHTRGLYNKWAILSHWSSSVVVCVYISVGLANRIKLSFMSDGTAHAAARKWTGLSLYLCCCLLWDSLHLFISCLIGLPRLALIGHVWVCWPSYLYVNIT
jgi:hypothetical protein